jgi:hypothetical protein
VASTIKTLAKNPDQKINGIPARVGVILFSLKIITGVRVKLKL